VGRKYSGKCSSGACVNVTEVGDGYMFSSTISGNDGAVSYTAAETAEFLDDVKAGRFDDLHRDARKRSE
jgi:hypothetical protein